MKKKRMLAYTLGVTWALTLLLGMILLIPLKAATVSTAIVVICLSLASGLLIPNHLSLIGLIAGICMLILPPWIVGLVLIAVGIAGALANVWVSKKYLKVFPADVQPAA